MSNKIDIYMDNTHQKYDLNAFGKNVVSFGRSSDCDIQIRKEYVSRVHGCFYMENGKWFIKDMNSTNGLYYNSNKIDALNLDVGNVTIMKNHASTDVITISSSMDAGMYGAYGNQYGGYDQYSGGYDQYAGGYDQYGGGYDQYGGGYGDQYGGYGDQYGGYGDQYGGNYGGMSAYAGKDKRLMYSIILWVASAIMILGCFLPFYRYSIKDAYESVFDDYDEYFGDYSDDMDDLFGSYVDSGESSLNKANRSLMSKSYPRTMPYGITIIVISLVAVGLSIKSNLLVLNIINLIVSIVNPVVVFVGGMVVKSKLQVDLFYSYNPIKLSWGFYVIIAGGIIAFSCALVTMISTIKINKATKGTSF